MTAPRSISILLFLFGGIEAFSQSGVGIDVAIPQEKLDVDGRLHLSSEFTLGPPNGGAGTIRWNGVTGEFQGWDGAAWIPFGPGTEVDPTWDGSALFTGASWRSGDIGLGMTAAPNSKLQVIGRTFIDNSANVHALSGNPALVVDGALSEDILRIRDVGANNRLLVNAAGLVGISTSIPTARLSIATIGGQTELGGTAASTTFKTNTGGLGTIAGNNLKLASIGFTSTLENISLGIQALRTANGTSSATTAIGLKFDVDATSPVNNSEIWLTHAGNIGIGTSAPTATLDVNGKIRGTAIYSTGSSSITSTTTSTVLAYNADITTTITVQANDVIKVDCACNLANSTAAGITYLTINNSAGTGSWAQTPNSIVSTGTTWNGGYSTGIFLSTTNGTITFQGRWRVSAGTGSAQSCNIQAVVIGKQ